MSFKVEKIIYHEEGSEGYSHAEYTLDETYLLPFFAGKLNDLIPWNAKLEPKTSTKYVDTPLFNESGLFKIIVEVGKYGLYYLQLKPGNTLDQLFVEPENVNIDIYFGKEKSLIYSFYNTSKTETICITGKRIEDTDNIYLKIKNDPVNLELRQYFLYKSMGKIESEEEKQKYPDIMTTEQVANYLQISKKTIDNWRSEGIIPFIKLKGAVRYRKTDIDKWVDKGSQ